MSWVHEYPACIFCRSTAPVRSFYTEYFAAEVVLDLGWYLSLNIPGCTQMLRFVALREEWVALNRHGQTYNIEVADVDREVERLRSRNLKSVSAVQNYHWGDRAFYVADPAGVLLYVHSEGQLSSEILECIRKYR